jgi:hypothetical protein
MTVSNFPPEHFTDGLMGLDSVPFLEDIIDTTTYMKMKVVFWGNAKLQI